MFFPCIHVKPTRSWNNFMRMNFPKQSLDVLMMRLSGMRLNGMNEMYE
jgi:hypothetical protein